MRHMKNEWGLSLIGLLLSVVIIGIILTVAVPTLFGDTGQEDTESAVGAAEHATTPINGTMVEAAAEMAYLNGEQREQFTLLELVELGYLNTDLSDVQKVQTVTHTGAGSFRFNGS